MKFKYVIFTFILLIQGINILKAQKEDHIWLLGGRPGIGSSVKFQKDTMEWGTKFDFNHDPVRMTLDTNRTMDVGGGNATIGAKYGQIKEDISIEILAKTNTLIAKVQALPLPHPHLAFHKLVWLAQLKYEAQGLDAILPQEWADVRTIANMCPLEVGDVVYRAQSMLRLIDEIVETDIETKCQTNSQPRSKYDDVIGHVSVYPNPSTGRVSLQLPDGVAALKITIYDVLSNIVKVLEAPVTLDIDMSDSSNGVYFYTIETDRMTSYQGKFIIIE